MNRDTASKMQAIAAATRALSAQEEVELTWGSNAAGDDPLYTGKTIALAAFPASDESLDKVRGEADLSALVLQHHNAKHHRKSRPHALQAADIYDKLELARIECKGAAVMDGVRHNITARNTNWYEIQGYSRVSDQAEPPLGDILACLLREKALNIAPPAAMQTLVNNWRKIVEQKAGESLAALAKGIDTQQAFSSAVFDLLKNLDIDSGDGMASRGDPNAANTQQNEEGETDSDELTNTEEMPTQASASPSPTDRMPDEDAQKIPAPAMLDDMQLSENEEEDAEATPNWEKSSDATLQSDFYQIYTRKYDEIVMAHELASPEELSRLRQQLDTKLMQFHGVTSRLAARLQRLLMARRLRHWEFEQEEGMIDASRLPQVVISPDFPYYYKKENEAEFRDTVVTLLLDNSGSMRGRPITVAALSADILARTLERCGVKVEILGFTTRDWKGGSVRKQWVTDGSPANPGRLNDLRHIIYKSADQRWMRGRKNLGLMLKDGILKENIDGEALLWAHDRLLARSEDRKILMVISDGAPVDDSTLSVNNGSYLDRHLREAIEYVESRSPVELLAIGIGHDVTRYYNRAVTLTDVNELSDTMVRELTELFNDTSNKIPSLKVKKYQ
ncbi:MAG: cobaltochelatase subunit CobT [Alphaproteobacteria bacterium]|nr:cobaltochelatase subunit CobT [Alphaproteobacteria bacterium]